MAHQFVQRPEPRGSNVAGRLAGGEWMYTQAALDSIGDAVICTDIAGRVTYLNRAAEAVNDAHGHAVGDRVLSSVASRLRQSLRQSDSVARVGGDEFVIVLSEITHDADAALVGTKLLQAIAAPQKVNGRTVTVTASLGLALYPDDALKAKDLIAHADVAMYNAKRCGHGTCQFFQAGMTFGSSSVRSATAG